MKKLGVFLVILLLATGITFAQERGGGERPSKSVEQGRPDRQQMTPEQRVQRETQRLVEQLKLNKEQEAKVLAINKKYMEKQSGDWSKMRDASDEERAKMRDAMQKVQAEKNKEIKVVLTPEQVKLFDENLKKREEMRKSRQGGMGGQGQ
ncbi:MAG TPA: hypothetical protein VFC65_02420 [Prolixibacteraceae bacterium]|nr:hypothetical protein [Prolixibacteraceae bacterium]